MSTERDNDGNETITVRKLYRCPYNSCPVYDKCPHGREVHHMVESCLQDCGSLGDFGQCVEVKEVEAAIFGKPMLHRLLMGETVRFGKKDYKLIQDNRIVEVPPE